ncbi:MAG: YqgE/AlgH family protein, partial [Leptospiraceae bacterium]|nr:YqgE/AlgH family protein [Leptospiraceae bacterium]
MPDDFHSYQGKLLISNSSIVTDAFHKSVIFMIEHDKQGAFGLVVNKKTERKLFELVPALPFEYSYDVPIFWGGPVDHTFVSILHDHSSAIDPGIEVIPGVYISRSFELLNHIIKIRGCHFIILQGYSGWGSGQLESEFER